MIYVITCGEYEDVYISLVTDDYNKALIHIFERYNYRGKPEKEQCSWHDEFCEMGIWENNKLVCSYGKLAEDRINSYVPMSYDELDADIQKRIKEIE